jgi:hypothetical protein
MWKWMALASAAAALAACGPPKKPVCYFEACSVGSATFQQCSDGDSCWYLTDSGRTGCRSCNDCTGALQSVNAWCATATPPPSGTTCGALLSGGTTTGGSAQANTKLQAFASCAQQQCGASGTAFSGPCATDPSSTACTTCFNNIQVNNIVAFTDMSGNPLVCQPSNASNCMACGNQVAACVLDCNNNGDCTGITCTATSAAATCQQGTCSC